MEFTFDVIPGITAVQALTARHRIPLNDVGEPVLITTGRQLRNDELTGSAVVMLDGEPYVAVGVLPKGFQADPEADVWVALQADPNSANQGHYLAAAARLKPGVSLAAARSDLQLAGDLDTPLNQG